MNTVLPKEEINSKINHLFRYEYGKMVAVLSRLLGLQNINDAEDIVQDTLVQAMNTWMYSEIPQNPSAWLYRVAKNKAIDFLRRKKRFSEISSEFARLLVSEYTLTPTVELVFTEHEMQDSQLKMIFACCHPAIPTESQIALALKILCGLNISEIARGFLCGDETISKRIYRAKEKIIAEKLELEFPGDAELPARLDNVLQCLYLLFNEGYNSSHSFDLIREELCEEAMRLTYFLTLHKATDKPRTSALLALFCFQASRLNARCDQDGNIILLQNQDRNKWFQPLIKKGSIYMEIAFRKREISFYHLEAGIAFLHANSLSFEDTDWALIYQFYRILSELHPSPVIDLNKAIAAKYAISKEFALDLLLKIKGLESYYLYYTSLGEIYFELERLEKAKPCFEKALLFTNSRQVKLFLEQKIDKCVRHFA